VKANAAQIRAALARPGPDTRLFLLHGPDAAGAAALAATLAKAMGPDAERIDLDGATLKADPARLADEAAALSLFGGARHIRISGVGEESHDALAALLDADRAGNPVVAIAPTLKTTAKVVKLALAHPRAMAFGCYLPEGQEAERMVADLAREQGLRLAPGVAERLAEGAGGDRAVVARELEKLALYLDAAPDRPHDCDHAALDAIGADLAEAEGHGVIGAILRGDAAALGTELLALEGAGASPIPWLRAGGRRLIALAEMRAAIDAGEPADRVIERHRVNFREKAETGAALRRWTAPMLAQALDRLRAAERAAIAPGSAGSILAVETATTLARRVARRG
jgi:DNA polymerase III subunit delta